MGSYGRVMYNTVLVPVDGSSESMTAAAEATEIASSEATVHALSVVEKLPMHRRSGKAEKFETDDTEAHTQAEEATAAVAELVESAGLDCVTSVSKGVPSREIVDGKRGASDSAGDILGSTTERILKNSPTTVVAVPA